MSTIEQIQETMNAEKLANKLEKKIETMKDKAEEEKSIEFIDEKLANKLEKNVETMKDTEEKESSNKLEKKPDMVKPPKTKKKSSKQKKDDINYEKLDQNEHVLHRPDMYVGSVIPQSEDTYVVDRVEDIDKIGESSNIKIVKKNIEYPFALARIFIEAVSNAIDNKWRSEDRGVEMTKIDIHVNKVTGETSVYNDGLGISTDIHPKEKIPIPELIFGNLLTSSNFNDSEARLTAGRNGVGISLTNIFSKVFTVDIVNSGKRYTQTWQNNMKVRGDPLVVDVDPKTRNSTKVTWIPDFERFQLSEYSQNIIDLFHRYACDTAMITKLNVIFNDIKVPIKSMIDYANLYGINKDETILFSTEESEVLVTSSKAFEHISFVNGVYTPDGGEHVDAWTDAILKPLTVQVNNKLVKKDDKKIPLKDVKQYFKVFINCFLVNPGFLGQEKRKLTVPSKKKIETEVPDESIKTMMKWGFVDKIEMVIKGKKLAKLNKTSKKKSAVEGLDHANYAGTENSRDCSLILCEGLSAKTYAVKGLKVGVFGKTGRNYFGIYALRGKCLNTRNAGVSTIMKNKEVTGMIKALGIQCDVDYTIEENFNTLNYGRLIILADEDDDGIHIAGLIINMFHHMFPSIMKRDKPFITAMKTPLVRVNIKNNIVPFYDSHQFNRFMSEREASGNVVSSKHIKYCKGLGTSTDKDITESFGRRMVEYIPDEKADESMMKAFSKSHAKIRKDWLAEYNPNNSFEIDNKDENSLVVKMNLTDFVDRDLIRFSISDCARSIPNVMDGLKESQRKIIYATFLKGLKFTSKTMKVAQLAGFVAEKTNYHHGEQNLYDTITKMAHDFVGSNNIPLMYRDGQMGSRSHLGQDAASARYIFTKADMYTRLLFREEDDPILEYVNDDGDAVEPKYYVPIIPTILINGSEGIGTGWSTSIPCFNPLEVVKCVKIWINGGRLNRRKNVVLSDYPAMVPWYKGFTGKMVKDNETRYSSYGRIERVKNKVLVVELPVGKSTDSFKQELELLVENKNISSYKNYSDANTVNFEIRESRDGIKCTENNLKLYNYIFTSNMVGFDHNFLIRKYDYVEEIINEFCEVRLEYYIKRKAYILNKYKHELLIQENKERFLASIMDKTLVIDRRSESDVVAELEEKEFSKIDGGYEYLLRMSIRSFTKQKLESLRSELSKLKVKIEELSNTTEKELWLKDIDEFETLYRKNNAE